MKKLICHWVAFFAAFPQPFFAQTPVADQQWIGTGLVRALVQNDGTLASDFQVPRPTASLLTSCLGELSIWAGGIDQAGNLRLAVQNSDTARGHFRGGFRNLPGSDKVWKVTQDDIKQHRADWLDNGQIDQPNPAVFAWPGAGNPFSGQYNGFSVEGVAKEDAAPFWEENQNQEFEPNLGEFPSLDVRVDNAPDVPSEMVFAPFYEKLEPDAFFPNRMAIGLAGDVLWYTYDCDEMSLFKNTVFGRVALSYQTEHPIDSFFIGVFINGNVGDPNDDYLGYRKSTSEVYFYNANLQHDALFGPNPPMIGLDAEMELRDWKIDSFEKVIGVSSLMPLHTDTSLLNAGMLPPTTDIEFYNYLTGSWRTGLPLTYGGTGYNFAPTAPTAKFAFPDFPGGSGGWSERAANNTPGDRRGLLACGPRHIPDCSQGCFRDVFRFSINHVEGGHGTANQIAQMDSFAYLSEDFFYTDFAPPSASPFDSLVCFHPTLPTEEVFWKKTAARIFPNPAADLVHLDFGAEKPAEIIVLNTLGDVIFSEKQPSSASNLFVRDLPDGLYFLHWRTVSGQRGIAKLMVQKF